MSYSTLGFSWLVVSALGLLPLAEAFLHRSPSITPQVVIAFLIAVGSGAVLRRRYTWVGVALHIYSQIAIWLSLFCASLTMVLIWVGPQ
ncbi:hypothetical protein A8V01_16395 [Novosphingobium guangzhouense]|uniref:Uncharacterized protein n=1 Tax=Novosphingobium guangzhouense TaxID=1850347 RepID=A0A2K2G341_9SPHN|nr:hypothetical protein A8V01_16395 [Novosphingobium guangzhouense]